MDISDVREHATEAGQPEAELAGLVLIDVGDQGAVAAGGDEQVAWRERHDVEEGEAERGGEDDEGGRGEGRGGRWGWGGWVVRADGAEGAALHVGDVEGEGEERERSWSWSLGGWTNGDGDIGMFSEPRLEPRCEIDRGSWLLLKLQERNVFQLCLEGSKIVDYIIGSMAWC
jgi:hypothetical protein